MTDTQKRFLGSIIRTLLLIVFNPFAKHHFVDSASVGPFVDDLVNQILPWVISGGAAMWSLAQKWVVSKLLQVSAALPAGSTTEDAKAVLKVTAPGIAKLPAA